MAGNQEISSSQKLHEIIMMTMIIIYWFNYIETGQWSHLSIINLVSP